MVFGASHQKGRKILTHEHLAKLPKNRPWSKDLGMLVKAGRSPGDLGRVFNEYGNILQANGLEHELTTEDRRFFLGLDSVAGVKGSGAFQADAIIVVVNSGGERQSVLDLAEQRDLRLICNGIKPELGMQ